MLVSGAIPASSMSIRGKNTLSTSITVVSPGRTVKRNAPAVLRLSSRAWITMVPTPGCGRSSQKARNSGNSSGCGVPVPIARPRADRP